MLPCIICHYFICIGFFFCTVSVNYNEQPSLSSLVWQIQNILRPLHMAPSPGSDFCLSWDKGVSTHCWNTHFTCVYMLTVADAQITNHLVAISHVLQETMSSPNAATMGLPSALSSRTWHVVQHMGDPTAEMPSDTKPCGPQDAQRPPVVLSCKSSKQTRALPIQGSCEIRRGSSVRSVFCERVEAILSISLLIEQ